MISHLILGVDKSAFIGSLVQSVVVHQHLFIPVRSHVPKLANIADLIHVDFSSVVVVVVDEFSVMTVRYGRTYLLPSGTLLFYRFHLSLLLSLLFEYWWRAVVDQIFCIRIVYGECPVFYCTIRTMVVAPFP